MLSNRVDEVPSISVLSNQRLTYTSFRRDLAILTFERHMLTISIDLAADDGSGTDINSFFPSAIQLRMEQYPEDVLETAIAETGSAATILGFAKCGTVIIPSKPNVHIKVEDVRSATGLGADINIAQTYRVTPLLTENQWNMLYAEQQAFVCGVLHKQIGDITPPSATLDELDYDHPYMSLLRIQAESTGARMGQSTNQLMQNREYELTMRCRGNAHIIVTVVPRAADQQPALQTVITPSMSWRTIRLNFTWKLPDGYGQVWFMDTVTGQKGTVDLTDVGLFLQGVPKPTNLLGNGRFEKAAGDPIGWVTADAPIGSWGTRSFVDNMALFGKTYLMRFVDPAVANLFQTKPWEYLDRAALEYFIQQFDPAFLVQPLDVPDDTNEVAVIECLWARVIMILNRFIQIPWNMNSRAGAMTLTVNVDTSQSGLVSMETSIKTFVDAAVGILKDQPNRQVNAAVDILTV